MTLRSICLSCALVLIGGSGVACGSDDSGSKPYSSGLPANKIIDTLTDADITILCLSLHDHISNDRALRSATCHFLGFVAAWGASLAGTATDADLQKACTDSEAMCKSTPPTSEQSTCTRPPSGCAGTVGEFEACVTDSVAAASKQLAAYPACSSVTASTVSKLFSSGGSGAMPMTAAPASCTALERKCPGIQNSTGLTSGNPPSSGSGQ